MRAVDGAGNPGRRRQPASTLEPSPWQPCPSPSQAPQGRLPYARLPCPAWELSRSPSSTSSTRSIPSTGELIPDRARGLSGSQSSLGRRGPTDHAPGGAQRIRRLPGPARAAILRPGRSSPSWSSTDRPPRRSRSSSAAIIPSHPSVGPLPDPIVPLGFPQPPRRPTPRTRACTSRSMSRTTCRPGITPAR